MPRKSQLPTAAFVFGLVKFILHARTRARACLTQLCTSFCSSSGELSSFLCRLRRSGLPFALPFGALRLQTPPGASGSAQAGILRPLRRLFVSRRPRMSRLARGPRSAAQGRVRLPERLPAGGVARLRQQRQNGEGGENRARHESQ